MKTFARQIYMFNNYLRLAEIKAVLEGRGFRPNFLVNDNISITPGVWILVNPENDSRNDTQWVWLLRTGFNF